MTSSISRQQLLTDLLHKYQRRYNPVYISLVTKEEFLDIFNLLELSENFPNGFLQLSEDEWLILKNYLVKAFNTMNFDEFIMRYFTESENIEYELKCNDNVCALTWQYHLKPPQDSFFHRSGAAMIREMGVYWIFMLFSAEIGEIKKYELEMDVLGHLIEQLEEKMN